MQAYLSVRFSLTNEDYKRMRDAQDVLVELRDAISKTGDANDAVGKLEQTIQLLTDIVLGKEI